LILPISPRSEIEGQIVIADILHTQTEMARSLVEDKKADYVFTV